MSQDRVDPSGHEEGIHEVLHHNKLSRPWIPMGGNRTRVCPIGHRQLQAWLVSTVLEHEPPTCLGQQYRLCREAAPQ